MLLSLCACGKSKAVKSVEKSIASIGEVTLDSEAQITDARKAYDALSKELYSQVLLCLQVCLDIFSCLILTHMQFERD